MSQAAGAQDFDVLVLGGGAAGLMTALVAGARGRRVAVLEHQESVGKKIAISGGGRCNFTNLDARPEGYLSSNPEFCKSALARYRPANFLSLVEAHGIAYHEKKLGQLFCDGSARKITEMLLAECAAAGVRVQVGAAVLSVEKTTRFQVETAVGRWTSSSLVVATGGLSFPKLGATDFGYRTARKFGHPLVETRPGLVPLTFHPDDRALHELSGLALPVIAHAGRRAFAENLLFTHRGLSGPAVLQISSYWQGKEPLLFDLLPGIDAKDWIAEARRENADLLARLSRLWPRRFAEAWSARHVPEKTLAQFTSAEITALGENLQRWPMRFSGTEGYPKAEVTVGGVDTRELSSKTMESRHVPGLFFVGEVVDVTGWLGGYNFQWAWASGHAAGSAA